VKKLFSMSLLFAAVLGSFCCAPRHSAITPDPSTPERTEPVEVRMWKEFEITLHVDTDMSELDRTHAEEASRKWRVISSGHIRINLEYDLDFGSTSGLLAHEMARHSLVVLVQSTSPVVRQLDAQLGGPKKTVLAATTIEQDRVRVFLITDRIEAPKRLSVLTHEFGHVAGFPDLPNYGSIMSGAAPTGAPPVNEFTAEDTSLCRGALLCF
jgi:hypothetical protein